MIELFQPLAVTLPEVELEPVVRMEVYHLPQACFVQAGVSREPNRRDHLVDAPRAPPSRTRVAVRVSE